uniref:PDZ domain-containing protein n=1 Tax=Alexandrium monilatum TaxID=311494 RepID=A0A7S4QVB6_9DINO
MACCCLPVGGAIEPWDLPIEVEQALPSRMTQLEFHYGGKDDLTSKEGHDAKQEEVLKLGTVVIEPGGELGLNILHSAVRGLIVISGTSPGSPWARWNETHPDHMIQPGDKVIAVNDRQGDFEQLLLEMTATSPKTRMTSMVVKRPVENRVRISKLDGDTLGLNLITLSNGLVFIDAVIPGGLVDLWNKTSDRKVKILDYLVEVNRKRGEVAELVEAMKENRGDFELVLRTHPD